MPARRKYTKDVLKPIVAESVSMAEVIRRLGLRQAGGTHTHISRTIRRLGIDTSHFRPHAKPRSPMRRTPAEILILQPDTYRREKPRLLTRALVESGIPYVCSSCGNDGPWQGQQLTLEVDHIDGNFLNNVATNLRFLCPNCHRLTPNFAGRSRGKFSGDPPTSGPAKPRTEPLGSKVDLAAEAATSSH